MGELIFSKIENEDIFVADYQNFTRNNVISFSKEGIAVVYGPNGVGKTSLVNALGEAEKTAISYTYEEKNYSDKSQFYIINDQNNRNIIAGTAKDFLLGNNVRKEFELSERLDGEYKRLCEASISILKTEYGVSSSSSKAITYFTDVPEMQGIIKDFTNSKSKGKRTGFSKYVLELKKQMGIRPPEYEEEKLEYIIKDLSEKSPLINDIEAIDTSELVTNPNIREVEENTEAIKILSRFDYKNQCIVCDSPDIDTNKLLSKKKINRETIIKSLDEKTKNLVEKIATQVNDVDPFNIKNIMLDAIESGELNGVILLKESLKKYTDIFVQKVISDLVKLYVDSDIKDIYEEYQKLLEQKPDIDEEDFVYIQEIISGSMNKNLQVNRDAGKNIKITLDNKAFLEVDRKNLPLSSGEQNFLSLTFEFLKAKHAEQPIVILDDPISSFDSIYKNKIAYAIIKILQNKKRIILTHNIDLLRLLDGQYKKCFRLFLFNNTEGEENGFIALNFEEQDMLINLEKLLETFRNNIYRYIHDPKLFLIAMIPFMRGYAAIVNDQQSEDDLTKLMHGYNTNTIDIAKVYRNLFGNKKGELSGDFHDAIPNEFKIDVCGILDTTVDGKTIIDREHYPLLNRTLSHSFNYLFLRLLIEKKLVSKFHIDTNQYFQLGQIISQAFPDDCNMEDVKNRVMLTSKKTLLNEFNHFEGNMSIFQPAIDITDHVLEREKDEILSFVNVL